ncbi:LysR substrate-binding domain-containing protein [Longimicrobium sp.]|uniref:LysR substrate-binding domain-containing protein n=1 Tax=Longimicrobium sp. TaxID=2029185 RepID=UPI002E2FBEEB|nr:LysR substrate-binding domain-containing protein [Longimicrobium sp.]HEX6041923.1 LysR substrate-binding domain-containing protein [Longimicrobium sp.]
MTLTQLAYAVAVDTHGHFGRAADACYVTQPALSMQIRKLERELGAVLFDRTRTPVVPTEVGRMVVEQARVVLREAARVAELRGEAAGATTGTLRVGVLPTLGPYLLPRFVHALARRHPQLELVLEEGLTADLLERVRGETLDVALIATDEAPDLVPRPLFDEPLMAYVSRGHPLAARDAVAPEDLPREDFWLLSEAHCLHAQTLQLCQAPDAAGPSCTRGISLRSGNLETLKRLVENGEGFTLLPALAVEDHRRDHPAARLVPFAEPAPTRRIRLVRRRVYLKRPLVEAFVDSLLASLPPEVRVHPTAGPTA